MCLSPLENARRVDFSSGLARRRRARKRSSPVVAETAWPRPTRRVLTRPSKGARILARSRLREAWSRLA